MCLKTNGRLGAKCLPVAQHRARSGVLSEGLRRALQSNVFPMDEPRISVEKCRELTGTHCKESSEEQVEELLEGFYSICTLIVEAYERFSSFDVETLNSPGVDDALRRLGWDIDDDAPDQWTEGYDAAQE
jgi:hypothetical protein